MRSSPSQSDSSPLPTDAASTARPTARPRRGAADAFDPMAERIIDRQIVVGAIMVAVPLAAGLAFTTLPAGAGARGVVGHLIRVVGLTGALGCIVVLLALAVSVAVPPVRRRRRALLVIGSMAAVAFAGAWLIGRLI